MAIFAIFLTLAILLCDSVLASILLFIGTSLYISLLLCFSSLLLSLLTLLVYLGALLILFAYIWIFISFSSRAPFSFTLGPAILFALSCSTHPFPSSLSPYLYSTAFLLYLVTLLFFAIVVVVSILDLSLGGFTS